MAAPEALTVVRLAGGATAAVKRPAVVVQMSEAGFIAFAKTTVSASNAADDALLVLRVLEGRCR